MTSITRLLLLVLLAIVTVVIIHLTKQTPADNSELVKVLLQSKPAPQEYSRLKCKQTGKVCILDDRGKIIDSFYEKPSPIDTTE